MTDSTQYRSGKGTGDENFPVASWLVKSRHRPVIHAFYDFVRTADDIADHPALPIDEKLARLDSLEASLLGGGDELVGGRLWAMLRNRNLSPRHAQDLLHAFRQDVTKCRYNDWGELIDYCAYSAMPVGRFVLDVHSEMCSIWPASDALCTALQIINHLQDCASDYKRIDRVYIPLNELSARHVAVEALGEPRASPALLDALHTLATRTADLLERSRDLPASVADSRLAVEISVIQALAARQLARLTFCDPLSELAHLSKAARFAAAARGAARGLLHRLLGISPSVQRFQMP